MRRSGIWKYFAWVNTQHEVPLGDEGLHACIKAFLDSDFGKREETYDIAVQGAHVAIKDADSGHDKGQAKVCLFTLFKSSKKGMTVVSGPLELRHGFNRVRSG